MSITVRLIIEAECDVPPRDDERFTDELDSILDKAEDELAGALLEAGASFAIESKHEVDV